MLILESLLLTILLAVLVSAGYTDCRHSIIKNRLLAVALICSIPINILYYTLYADEYLPSFLLNLAVMAAVAFFFYAYHLWAAGDSKLFFVVGLLIPGRHYSFWDIGAVPSFVILIIIFTLAFLYVIVESVIIGTREKSLLHFSGEKIDYKQAILSYLTMVAAVMVVSWLIWKIFARSLNNDIVLSLAVNFLIVLTLIQLRNHLDNRGLLIAAFISWAVVICLVAVGEYQFKISGDLRSWALIFVIMFVRVIAEKYNYQTIPTQSVRAGQIMSAVTIMNFKVSRVQGLPTATTEDLRSRITNEEAESIKRWETSKHGKPFIIIVRKIPFAVFIGIGTACFIILGVAIA